MTEHGSGLTPQNLPFAEALWAQFLRDPDSVPEDWRRFFANESNGDGAPMTAGRGPSFKPPGLFSPRGGAETGFSNRVLQDRVDQLVRSYRVRGHMVARLDPLRRAREPQPELEPSFYGLTESDLDRQFSSSTLGRSKALKLRQILKILRNTYCRYIGVQYMHIDDPKVKKWLQTRMESSQNRITLERAQQLRILKKLTDAVVLEEFIQRKYVGAKSFSLEGAETLIPLLDLAISKACDMQVGEVILGMAHRGRLNVLANVVGKSPRFIFREFDDTASDAELFRGRGDVKYHLGYNNEWKSDDGKSVHISLCFNPSHLEFVNPVALGRLRAKIDRFAGHPRGNGLSIIIHGDASFAGEGIVPETLNLSQLPGYTVGGTIHVIVNNQIGFTTGPQEARSGNYATDVAKMLQIPIFHVNGEHPEAVAQVIDLALDFRKEFQRDVVIDMYCYRRRGHNEGDEPAFTHPRMYKTIREKKPVRESYVEYLLELGGISQAEADALAEETRERLEKELSTARSKKFTPPPRRKGGIWAPYKGGKDGTVAETKTGLPKEQLQGLLARLTSLPDDFHPHPKIARMLRQRREMADGERPLDWAAAEALAFASLLVEGTRVRFTGQDCERGTFSHRHAVLHDHEDGHEYRIFRHVADNQAPVEIYNSPLSEAAVLGFEYGYSLDYPDALVLWEAQFGDFVNAAQVIIDQFLVSAEDKWRRLSGLVMLLPHGFEGMGPEHSSARLERFLTLAAEDNIQVMNLTTPASIFHALRRQVVRPWRKPLIIMTPKSLLRHPEATSSLDDLAENGFLKVLDDPASEDAAKVRRILVCTGKVYYDLAERKRELGADDVAILRMEQIYPVPRAELEAAVQRYPGKTEIVWVQEEPENMGAWRFIHYELGGKFFDNSITRNSSASPATGSASAHRLEQEEILRRAFDRED
ncbi:MAG: 2-oxoglutarate dehydrogenase E1 component [Planctomycetota bacterium]